MWGAADGKMQPEAAELQDWHVWNGLVTAGLTLSAVAGPAWAPGAPCAAALNAAVSLHYEQELLLLIFW